MSSLFFQKIIVISNFYKISENLMTYKRYVISSLKEKKKEKKKKKEKEKEKKKESLI